MCNKCTQNHKAYVFEQNINFGSYVPLTGTLIQGINRGKMYTCFHGPHSKFINACTKRHSANGYKLMGFGLVDLHT
jgi:hypothetical protein